MKAVILSYNHPDITEACLKSVLRIFQSDDCILVHNGSLEKNVFSLREKFRTIHHIILEKNLGFSGGANAGLKFAFESQAEFAFFFSNDTQLENYRGAPKCDLVAPLIKLRSTENVASLGGLIHFSQGTLSHIQKINDQSQQDHFYVPGASFIMSKNLWERTGGFDQSLGSYWEDVDLSLRAKKLGLKLGVDSETTVRHGVRKTTKNDPLYSVYFYQRNRRIVLNRHCDFKRRFLFYFNYRADTLGKLFKYLKNKDFARAKLILKAWGM